jgi:hypothetical protein
MKTVQSIRGMEARTKAKWERDGWELVEQADPSMLRTKLTFRRPKKSIRVPLLIAGGAVVVGFVSLVILGLVTGGFSQPASSTTSPSKTAVASPTRTVSPSSSATSPPATTGAPVTDVEVVSAFRSYFAERASAGVMVGKAVTEVSYSNRVVRVTFDSAAAGVTQEMFDQLNSFDNLASFAATTVAFNDPVGNRLRPAIDSIQTVNPGGVSLGVYSAADILALNGLSK